MDTHFQPTDLAYIITGLLFAGTAFAVFLRGKARLALWLLTGGGLILRLCMAFIDPYINLWDEQFHALVAKNMMEHPFHPMLYAHPVLPIHEQIWTGGSTWLHKPPLFLWQIALFMKIFGAKYWVVRLPSVLLTTLAIPAVFRMGKILSGERCGFFAATIFAVVNLQVNIVSGFINTDHNDIIFMCYVLFSLWAWMEHMETPNLKWILLVGLFSGAAILVKWLPGLLVYLVWMFALLLNKEERFVLKKWMELLAASVLTFIVAAPWFIYASVKWPSLSMHESDARIKHLSNVVEDHHGPWYFHFELLKEDYGWWMAVLLPLCLILFFLRKEKQPVRLAIGAAIIFVYAFYTCVPTRMPLFCLFVSPLLYLVLADVISNAGNYFKKQEGLQSNKIFRAARMFFAAFFIFFIFDIGRIEHFHTDRNKGNFYRPARIENKKQFESAAATLSSKDIVIFNCGGYANGVACMFYTGHTSYDHVPDEQQLHYLKSQGIKMAVFDDIPLPGYISGDSSVIKLHFPLVRNGF